jgi:hypothetical protein
MGVGGHRGPRVLTYTPSPTGRAFHASKARVKGVLGPVGSGKTVMCCWEIILLSATQIPDPYDKVRRSRWLVLRNTYRQLLDTTVRTWMDWFPQTKMHWSAPLSGVYTFPGMTDGKPDGTTVEIELNFMAMDDEDAVRNLKSLEVTGVWGNEASEMPWLYLSRAYERTGRYPKADAAAGVRFKSFGLLMDTNAPSDTSWWYQFAEVRRPDGFEFWRQPPAVLKREYDGKVWYEPNDGRDPRIDPAENIENHNEGWDYYMKQVVDGDHARIKIFLMAQYGATVNGLSVYPEYNDNIHYSAKDIPVLWGLPLFLGTDFGRTPATAICQMSMEGQFRCLDEVPSINSGIRAFTSDILLPRLINEYRMHSMQVFNFGDPAGGDKGQTDEQTCIQIMNELGIPTAPCPVSQNAFVLRREAVATQLRLQIDGKPGMIVGPRCKLIREGFNGRYYYKKQASADIGDDHTSPRPEKNMFSHIHDALQYVCYGASNPGTSSVFKSAARHSRFGMSAPRDMSVRMDLGGFY